jgi:nicotinamidase-related amidase
VRTALLVIDMQNAFFEDPVLAAEQERVVRECNTLIRAARAVSAPVYVIRTEHQRDKSTWTLSMLEDNQGFIFAGSSQAELVPGLDVDGFGQLVKTRDSAFFGTDLLLRLRNLQVERVLLAGVATHNCVAQTGADAFANNLRVSYAGSAMASTNAEYARQVLTVLSEEYRQQVLSAAESIQALQGRA